MLPMVVPDAAEMRRHPSPAVVWWSFAAGVLVSLYYGGMAVLAPRLNKIRVEGYRCEVILIAKSSDPLFISNVRTGRECQIGILGVKAEGTYQGQTPSPFLQVTLGRISPS